MELNEYPEALPDALQETPEGFEREARMAMAVKLLVRDEAHLVRHGRPVGQC